MVRANTADQFETVGVPRKSSLLALMREATVCVDRLREAASQRDDQGMCRVPPTGPEGLTQRRFSMSNKQGSASILDRLNKASSAEDFFALLGVQYDPKIVNVARLHILKRMGQYLAKEQFEGSAEEEVTGRCKAVLEQAYADFVTSSPIDQRVFKVLKDAVAEPKKPAAFVPLSSLT